MSRSLALAVGFASMLSASAPPPAGWRLAGDKPAEYAVTVEATAPEGKRAARLTCVESHPSGFGTLMQVFDATSYLGKRVRLTALVKAQGVAQWAGLWMRVDGASGPPLAFDNMQDRPIQGTTEWVPCSVVLEVHDHAKEIAFGVLLHGPGSVLARNFVFMPVGPEVPITGKPALPDAPINLNFEK